MATKLGFVTPPPMSSKSSLVVDKSVPRTGTLRPVIDPKVSSTTKVNPGTTLNLNTQGSTLNLGTPGAATCFASRSRCHAKILLE